MKSIVIYAKQVADFRHQEIEVADGDQMIRLFFRGEVVHKLPDAALDDASPEDGEIVVNAIPWPIVQDNVNIQP